MSKPAPIRRDPFTTAILHLFRANGQMLDWGDRFAAPFDLTSARWQMLGALAMASQPLTAPQIAVNMGVTRQGVQKQLNRLLQDGLVERVPNPSHKRSPGYRLSDSGNALYQRIDTAWSRHAEEMRGLFPENELTTAIRFLDRICELHHTPEKGEPG